MRFVWELRLGAIDFRWAPWQKRPTAARGAARRRNVDGKIRNPGGRRRAAKPSPTPETLNPLLAPTASLHARQLAEIEARGEDPRQILRGFDRMVDSLRAKHSVPPAKPLGVVIAGLDGDSTWSMSGATRYEEAVAAGTPVPTEATTGRAANLSDLLHGIDPEGKLLVNVSGSSMTGVHLQDGDTVMVDPSAEPRDGDLVLAHVFGLGQVVKRLRISPEGEATLESENAEFKPIKVSEASDLRIHGKVVWRCGRLS